MNITLVASGTRGDVQPVLALGRALRAAGYAVRVLAGANFAGWVAEHGLEFFPTVDIEAQMRSELGLRWVEARRPADQLGVMKLLLRETLERNVRDLIEGTAGAELLIGGFVSEPFVQAVAERRGVPQISVALQPYRATRSGPASILPLLPRRDSILNRWAGALAERISWGVARETAAALRARLGLPAHSARSYLRAARAIPALYAFSPHVVPPIDDANTTTTGYWFLDEPPASDDELRRFLAAGEPPVYLGFGSMPSRDPAELTRLVAEALERVGARGLLARGWNAAVASPAPERLFVLDSAPHHWLFPQVAALVHHGGAGTTAAGLRGGRPALLVPHMADQPYWGRRVRELGAGPPPLPRSQLSADTLASRLAALLGTPTFAANAARLGEQIRAERGVENAVAWIERFIRR